MPVGFPDYYGGLTLPVSVQEGGTGQTSVTAKALLYGAGTSKLIETNVGTSGQYLQIDPVTLDPTFEALSVDVSVITGILPVAHGGTGTATPALVAGTNIVITGSWPDQTIATTLTPSFTSVTATTYTATGAVSLLAGGTNQGVTIKGTGSGLVIIGSGYGGGNNVIIDVAATAGLAITNNTTNSYGAPALIPNGSDVIQTVTGSLLEIGQQGIAILVTFDTSGNVGIAGTVHAAGLTLATGGAISAGSLALTTPLPVASGGTGTATPALVAGTNIVISGSWPDQTIALAASPTITSLTISTYDYDRLLVGASGDRSSTGAAFRVGIPTGNTKSVLTVALAAVDKVLLDYQFNLTLAGALSLGTPLTVANGGTGTATPGLVAGTAISVTGTWPDQTINNTSAYASLADPLPVAHGGTGTATPALVAGENIVITGSWPNQTIATSDGPTFGTVVYVGVSGTGIMKLITSSNVCYMEFGITTTTGSAAPLHLTNMNNGATYAIFDTSGNLQLFGGLTVATPLSVANGGTGTTTPALVAGTNISISGTWPDQTVATVATPTFSGLTSNGTINIASGYNLQGAGANVLRLSDAVNTVINPITSAGEIFLLWDRGGSGGVHFGDGATNTKARITSSGIFAVYKTNNLAGNGIPSMLGAGDFTGETQTTHTTVILTPPENGLYRITLYSVITTAGSAGNIAFTIAWTDTKQAQTATNVCSNADTTAGNYRYDRADVYAKTTANLTITPTFTGVTGTPVFNWSYRIELM